MAEKILTTPTGEVRARWLAPNAVRITHRAPGQADFPADRPWLKDVLLPGAEAPAVEREVQVAVSDGRLQARGPDGQVFFSEAAPPQHDLRRRRPFIDLDLPKVELRAAVRRAEAGVRLAVAVEPGEGFYGWGEWFNAFLRRSGKVSLNIRDAIAGIQGRATYSAIPIFISTRGYAFFLLNSHLSDWEIDPGQGRLEIEADGPPADYLLIYGPSYKRIIETYTGLTGRPPLLPRWAFGLWVTSYPQDHQDKVIEHARQHRARQIPLDAAILDYHWEEAFHNFRWRASLIPNPEGMIEELKELGVRLGLIITPFVNRSIRQFQRFALNRAAHNIPPGHARSADTALPEYQEARARGYLAHPAARWWFGVGGMIDFTNPEAANWWHGLMRPLYEQGVAFFKNDDGEYLPVDGHSHTGMDGREYHNIYGFYYRRAQYEHMGRLDERRPLVYARSVWAGSQRFPALFLGDQKPEYESIQRSMRAGLNLGLLGFAYWTADVFGLDGKTTPETHMRYAQWALLVPVARYFWRPPEVDDTRFPWSHGLEAEANFRFYTELRYRLLPYYTALGWEAYQTGLPLVRPLALEFQEDERLAEVFDQVLLGASLMVCPVVEAQAEARRVVLPAGMWHDFWSGQSWQGPAEIEYPAPLERLPLLVRGGSIVLMGPVLQSISDGHRFDQLSAHIWPPYPATGLLYDDDGQTRAYAQGAFSRTHFRAEAEGEDVTIWVGAAQGSFPEQPESRQIELILHRQAQPARVWVNGQVWEGWSHEVETGETRIAVSCPSRSETVVICEGRGD